ncbi:3',5'-cyclic-nucleotide phosphodiesterase pde1 [Lambiella insularis]|nr:3',5'-cyclic-nucleotide phosphodiesterase pde1 [Lambiella insularis]
MDGDGGSLGDVESGDPTKAAFQVIVLGAGGGPSEDDVTGLLVRSTATQWAKGSILAVDAGTHLAAIIKILEQHQVHASRTEPSNLTSDNSNKLKKPRRRNGASTGVTDVPQYTTTISNYLGHVSGVQNAGHDSPAPPTDSTTPRQTLTTGPFNGLILPYESPRANASYLLRNLISTYLITHPHLDHLSGFAVNTASFQHTSRPKKVAALPSTINAIKDHIFNDVIWPNLSDEEGGVGLVSYMRLVEGGNIALGNGESKGYIELCDGLSVKAWSVSHGHCIRPHSHRAGSIPNMQPDQQYLPARRNSSFANGPIPSIEQRRGSLTYADPNARLENACVYDSSAFFIRDEQTGREVLVFGDVEPDSISLSPRTARVWADAAPKIIAGLLSAIFIECSYDDSQPDETLFGHLAPRHLIAELQVLADEVRAGKRESKADGNPDPDREVGADHSFKEVDHRLESEARRKRKRQSNGFAAHNNLRHGRTPYSKLRRSVADRDSSPLKGVETVSPSNSELSPTAPRSLASTMDGARENARGHADAEEATLSPEPITTSLMDLDAKSQEPKALAGLKIIVIHVKDTLRDGPAPGEIILAQLQDWEQKANLGCEFLISKAGGEFWIS